MTECSTCATWTQSGNTSEHLIRTCLRTDCSMTENTSLFLASSILLRNGTKAVSILFQPVLWHMITDDYWHCSTIVIQIYNFQFLTTDYTGCQVTIVVKIDDFIQCHICFFFRFRCRSRRWHFIPVQSREIQSNVEEGRGPLRQPHHGGDVDELCLLRVITIISMPDLRGC